MKKNNVKKVKQNSLMILGEYVVTVCNKGEILMIKDKLAQQESNWAFLNTN